MSEPDILNLDDLANEDEKAIVLGGTRHVAQELTVEAYIERVKRARAIDPNATQEIQVEQACVLLHDLFPTVPVERLKKLTMRQLGKLVEFALAAPKDIAEAPGQAGNA